jgi:hypothetical protein
MTKIILNLIFFFSIGPKLQNDHPTHRLTKGFSTIPKNATRPGPHGLRRLRCGHKTKQTPIFIYILITPQMESSSRL